MFDTVKLKCPYCRKDTESQTKILGDDLMDIIQVGNQVTKDFGDCIFQLKNNCNNCNKQLRIVIEKGLFKETTKEEPDIIEDMFSQYSDVRNIKMKEEEEIINKFLWLTEMALNIHTQNIEVTDENMSLAYALTDYEIIKQEQEEENE